MSWTTPGQGTNLNEVKMSKFKFKMNSKRDQEGQGPAKDVIVSLVSPYRDQREDFKNKLTWQLKEIHVHYNPENGRRGREKYWVENLGLKLGIVVDWVQATIESLEAQLILLII